MGSKLKNFLKKFLPPSAKASKGYTDTLLWRLDEIEKRIANVQAENARCAERTEKTLELLSSIIEAQNLLADKINDCRETVTEAASDVKAYQDSSVATICSFTENQTDRTLRELDTQIKDSNGFIENQFKATSELIENRFNGTNALIENKDKNTSELIESAKDYLEGEIFAAREKESAVADVREAAIINEIRENSDRACAAVKTQSKNISEKIDECVDELKRAEESAEASSRTLSEKIVSNISAVHDSISNLDDSNAKQITGIEKTLIGLSESLNDTSDRIFIGMSDIKSATEKLDETISSSQTVLRKELESGASEIRELSDKMSLSNENDSFLIEQSKKIHEHTAKALGHAAESTWAHIFKDTTRESSWLKEKNFSPGRWAVGYQYLYVMFRILDEAKPKRILDIGLGQTSKMLSQYAATHDDVQHIVIEDNAAWAEFFKSKNSLSERTKIHLLELGTTQFRDCQSIRSYEGFAETLANQKFDFISIDAPIGSDNPKYSRVDLLKILPDCLNSDFAIMIDDFERDGERRTFYAIKDLLTQNGISCHTTGYIGANKLGLITSSSWTFLNSL